jgi:hypothetical protein
MQNEADNVPSVNEVTDAFRKRFPDWENDMRWERIFKHLKNITRTYGDDKLDPKKIFLSFFDDSGVRFQDVEDNTGKINLTAWFAILTYFAGWAPRGYRKQFRKVDDAIKSTRRVNANSLLDLKTRLPPPKSEAKIGTTQSEINALGLSEPERRFINFCKDEIAEKSDTESVQPDSKTRVYVIFGKAGPWTNHARIELNWQIQDALDIRNQLAERDLIWLEGGLESREKGKRIGLWKMLL